MLEKCVLVVEIDANGKVFSLQNHIVEDIPLSHVTTL